MAFGLGPSAWGLRPVSGLWSLVSGGLWPVAGFWLLVSGF
jgi:hypothetical protein